MNRPVFFAWRPSCLALLALALVGQHASAQQSNVSVPGRGNGSFSVGFDYISIDSVDIDEEIPGLDASGDFFVTIRSLNFEFDYGLTDRLALTASLPYRSNAGSSTTYAHQPAFLIDDHGQDFLDTGDYHGYWADLGLGLRWQWRSAERFAITPFVSYYTPSNDYPIYALSQPGRGQNRLEVGFNASGRLGAPRRNMYWKAGYGYSYNEKTRPADAPARRVNRSRVNVEIGWRATPQITPYIAVADTTTHNGMSVSEFLPGIFVSDQWYYHDWLFRWEQTAWTLGAGYQLNDQMGLSFAYGKTGDVTFGFEQEPALSMSFTYAFARGP